MNANRNHGMHSSDRVPGHRSAELSDAELIERARSGDDDAFRVIVVRYEPLVAGTVIGMLGRGPEAEDAGQETFIRFWRSLHGFRGDSSIGTYLTRIAMNLSLNVLKRRSRMRRWFGDSEPPDQADPSAGPGEGLEQSDRARAVHEAIHTLPPHYRSVVVLRLVQGLSTGETARILGIPTGTVLSRLSRAQQKLRDLLAPTMPDAANPS